MSISDPKNEWQQKYNELCKLGGGRRGGPAETRVIALLFDAADQLNPDLELHVQTSLQRLEHLSPWHVCFAIGVSWGHLAKENEEFTDSASQLMSNWNDDLLQEASKHYLERGPDVLQAALSGGYQLFQKVRLPDQVPDTLKGLHDVQQRWLSPILSSDKPRGIGSWNAVAMFMAAVFVSDALWKNLIDATVLLPPGGPIRSSLNALFKDGLLTDKPEGSEFDESFEPGALTVNQAHMKKLLDLSPTGRSIVDVHSGLYMLGTNR